MYLDFLEFISAFFWQSPWSDDGAWCGVGSAGTFDPSVTTFPAGHAAECPAPVSQSRGISLQSVRGPGVRLTSDDMRLVTEDTGALGVGILTLSPDICAVS